MAKRKVATRTTTDQLASMIESLRKERDTLATRLAEIDETFGELGIAIESSDAAPATRSPGRPRKKISKKKKTTTTTKKKTTARGGRPAKKGQSSKRGGRRKRGTFPRTGEESVLAFVNELKSATAGEINKKWKAEGRGGSADNTLGRLVKDKKIVREDVPGQRGGVYKPAK